MPSTYSPNLRIELIANGEQANTWGITTNTNLGTLIEQAIAGLVSIDVTLGNRKLTELDGAPDESRNMMVNVTGAPGVARSVFCPDGDTKIYVVANDSTQVVTFATVSGTGVDIPVGTAKLVYCDGVDVYEAVSAVDTLDVNTATVYDLTAVSALIGNLTYTGTLTGGVGVVNIGSGQVYKDTSGNVGIGTASPGAKLNVVDGSSNDAVRITQTGSGNALVVEDSANPDSTPFVIDQSGTVFVGSTAPVSVSSGTPRIQVNNASATAQNNGMLVGSWAASASQSYFSFLKARGPAVGTYTIVQSGDRIGTLGFYGADGTAGVLAATIQAEVDGTPAASDMPGRLIFSTTRSGASTPTEVIRADSLQRVGIGGAPTTGAVLTLRGDITGGTTGHGAISLQTIKSDVTGSASIFRSQPNTEAAAFTLPNLRHFVGVQGTIGAGSSVTTQMGFLADSSLTGATNNYGFYSSIASGTGRYNFYAAGTADNYFAGSVGIGATASSGVNLHVGGSATGSTSTRAVGVFCTVQSDSTSSYQSFRSSPSTVAAAVTFSELTHYAANQGTIGSGSTVTSQYGFRAESSLSGATNNYGFYSNIASGTGRYNFYAAGTADNYFAGNIGVGSSGNPSYTLDVAKTATGGTLAIGLRLAQPIQSDVTSEWRGVSSSIVLSGSVTTTSARAYYANQGTWGSGASLTNQYGYYAESGLTGATNNYGFYSNIASAANRWNFYANGDAPNYFAGNVGIGTLTASRAVVSDASKNLISSATTATELGYVSGVTSAIQTQINGKQPSITVNGIVKGNGLGTLSAAVSGTDYAPATSGTSILYGNGAGGFSNVTVGSGMSFVGGTLAATGSGGSVTNVSVVSANGLAGSVATSTTTPAITLSTTITGLLKGNSGTGAITAAVSGTDYAPATSGSAILYGNAAGGFSNVTIGSGLSFSAGTLSSTLAGGTVTSVSVVSANGFTGTVANPTTTPAITLTTSASGMLKGNGTAISAATSGTDYSAGTSALATGILKSTTGTGALSIAVAGTDYQTAQSVTGLVKSSGTTRSAAVAGTDYVAPGGALGTPSSGTLTNCTFPTLNQNTTGSSGSCTGNAATATLATTATTANGLNTTGSYSAQSFTALTNGLIAVNSDAGGYGVRVTASAAGSQGIVQWTNNAGSTEWTKLTGTSTGLACSTAFTATSFSGAGTGLTGTATSLSIGGNAATATTAATCTGNAATATTLIGDQTNWASYRSSAVANMLGWKNYSNGHVIFDASNSTSPTGSAVNNTNATNAWAATYPTLMGWNGSTTFGVRVDSARVSDLSTDCTNAIGNGQTWQTVSRAFATNYTNSTGKPIMVAVRGQLVEIYVNGAFVQGIVMAYGYGNFSFIVPNGAYYTFVDIGDGSFSVTELR